MKKSKKMAKNNEPAKQSKPLRIDIDYNKTITVTYSNYAAINHSANEFFIDFCILSPPYQIGKDGETVLAHPVTRIIMPVEIAEGFVVALQTQLEKQKATRQSQVIDIQAEKEADNHVQ